MTCASLSRWLPITILKLWIARLAHQDAKTGEHQAAARIVELIGEKPPTTRTSTTDFDFWCYMREARILEAVYSLEHEVRWMELQLERIHH